MPCSPHRLLAVALLAATLHSQTPDTQLPVTRVSLYKNGVGFFEHAGRVTGNATVSIAFTTAQLNDVLQSLTAIDLGGGRIAGAGYNSTTPIEQQLKALFPLASARTPTRRPSTTPSAARASRSAAEPSRSPVAC